MLCTCFRGRLRSINRQETEKDRERPRQGGRKSDSMDAAERSSVVVPSPNTLDPEVMVRYFTSLLTESNQVSVRDLSDLQGRLTGQLTAEQVACLLGSRISNELGERAQLIRVGTSPLLVLDEVIGRRLAIQLNDMGYRGKTLVIYEAGGDRHELPIREAISLSQLCRKAGMVSTVTLTGIEIAPGKMTNKLSTFPIIELHSFSIGSGAPPIEEISPTINTAEFVQVQALSLTKASEISHNNGSDVASGHGGIRSRKYDGLTVDVGHPDFFLRRGNSCSEEEAREWAHQHLSPKDIAAAVRPVVFLCRVIVDGEGRRYPVL
ncbi:unnamed protein product [Pylaiella littoralis]